MRLRTVVKLGTIISVALFCLAIGYYAFMQLDTAGRNREVNLFSLIPQTSVSVLESDNINAFLHEIPMLNYGHEIEKFQFSSLFSFLLNGLNEYATTNAHGLSSQMSRMAVSFHEPFTLRDQIVYFGMGTADENMLESMLHEYAPSNFLPKNEEYRGKSITIYPLGTEEYLACYSESGFLVISHQKRLIEQVIDAKLDGSSLMEDDVFSTILQQKKSTQFLSMYSRSSAMPFLQLGKECWSEYNFHMNSDVLYLTGKTYMPDTCTCITALSDACQDTTRYEAGNIFYTTSKDSLAYYIDKVYDEKLSEGTLFNQCVANLSKDAIHTLVLDMQKVVESPLAFRHCLPPFLYRSAPLLAPFIFSTQYSLTNDQYLSHIWIFTYKD